MHILSICHAREKKVAGVGGVWGRGGECGEGGKTKELMYGGK